MASQSTITSMAPTRWDAKVIGRQRLQRQLACLQAPHRCPEGVYLRPDAQDAFRFHGVVFVRTGSYAPGVFRFSIQFTMVDEQLALPTVFFPPILMHPIVEPATGRLNLLPYLATTSDKPGAADPDHPHFVQHLLTFLHDCFQPALLAELQQQWVLNDRMFHLFSADPSLFDRLAKQSATLSTSPLALYDTQSGSGVPGDMDVTVASSEDQPRLDSVMPFEPLRPSDVARIRDSLVL
ncbi:hypothetical protein Malapachy_3585 [Malassezia pachydermatis]|uniref:UBC core domain-containing protein n=1 Tax=Malassezia pachydermatis TaxID=77020 RepID=A0A0M9VRC4_9BASI|nr:hypothetical protein Malapachy_3585 [Malassezia pachydermatis]KOS16465.1 hypothetical protein Malapachy_3585 [Malassezia pachydermatis]